MAFTGAPVCFGCWPGGPVAAPPCLGCGSIHDYFTNGRCARCHPMGPQQIDSCRDCFAWGATRHHGWRCIACDGWRQRRRVGTCRSCQRSALPLSHDGACRLCRKQRSLTIRRDELRSNLPDIVTTSRGAQQLFFADMFMLDGPRVGRRGPQPSTTAPAEIDLPVPWRQARLFESRRDPHLARAVGFPEPRDARVLHNLLRRVDDRAVRFGWSLGHTCSVRGAMRIVLGLQETPGAIVRASELHLLGPLGYSAPAVAAVLAEAGMLEDDLEPAAVVWFRSQVAELPDDIRHELGVWFDIMRHGSPTPPRRLPRQDATTITQLRAALPAVRHWATAHSSLREITRDEIKAILPTTGHQRSLILQSFRSIFRILKTHQLVFANPTTHMHAAHPDYAAPPPIDLVQLRAAIGAHDPARAAVAALLAFHAIRVTDLRSLQLTDIHDGRLHIGGRVVLLAPAARDCVAAYLDHRSLCWPNTINPHIFINRRSATHAQPVNTNWFRDTLGMAPEAVRRDRILDEAFATGGDLRQLTDMFHMSVSTADRYATIVHRARTADRSAKGPNPEPRRD